jgi:hypothetical protein
MVEQHLSRGATNPRSVSVRGGTVRAAVKPSPANVQTPIISSSGPVACHILLLDGKRYTFQAHHQSKVRDAFNAVCSYLGLVDSAYFGLARTVAGNEEFLDMSQPLLSYIYRDQLPELAFRIEFYVDNVNVLKDKVARHLYFLQVTSDLKFNAPTISSTEAIALAQWHMQSIFGDFDKSKHQVPYFALHDFLPENLLARNANSGDLIDTLVEAHQAARGHTQVQAESEYLLTAQVRDFNAVYILLPILTMIFT